MAEKNVDMNADINPDLGEGIAQMEPTLMPNSSRHYEAVSDLALVLVSETAALRNSLPQSILSALASLVRAMNCYYSNLIEGHNTHPIDIERALKDDYSTEPRKRDLQREAKAHIAVQQWIVKVALKAARRQLPTFKSFIDAFALNCRQICFGFRSRISCGREFYAGFRKKCSQARCRQRQKSCWKLCSIGASWQGMKFPNFWA